MDTKDSLFISQGEESYHRSFHGSKDSIDEDLNTLSLAISKKRNELRKNCTNDSQNFTLKEIGEDDSRDLEIEMLKMRIEDLESYLCEKLVWQVNQDMTYIPKKEGFALFHKTSFLDFSNSLDQNFINYVECSLTDLYQLVEDSQRIIRLVESDLKYLGRLALGSFKLDVKVAKEDNLIPDKEDIGDQMLQTNFNCEKSKFFDDVFADNPIFYMFEGKANEAFERIRFTNQIVVDIGKNSMKLFDGAKSSIINYLEYQLLKKSKKDENIKTQELDWQSLQAKAKKSSFFTKSKKIMMKEEELRKLNRNISQQIVKNAKDRERFEEDIEMFIKEKEDFMMITKNKVEMITKVLQEIEDFKVEEKEEPKANQSLRPYDVPSIIQEVPLEHQIKSLQEELVRLEYEYKSSTIPESLETISTNIDRVKSNLLNLQSLKVIKSTVRNSSAIRSRIKQADRNLDNISDHTSSSKEADTLKPRNLPHPFRNPNITFSPVRRLEVNTSRLDTSTLNSPSRRSPYLHKSENKETVELKKFLRKKEQELKEREEDLEYEENKVMQNWAEVVDKGEIVELIEKEVKEFRKNKQEFLAKKANLEREKFEWNERFLSVKNREKDCAIGFDRLKENEKEFERKKESIYQRLEWLKRKLLNFDC